MKKEDLSIVILAGGRAKRLGVDKSLISIKGKPLFIHTLERVRAISDDIIITTKTEKRKINLLPFVKDTVRIYVDEEPSVESALIGALTGIKNANNQLILLLGCDMPLIKVEVIALLYRHFTNMRPVCQAVIPQFSNQYIEPLCAIYDKNVAIEALEQAIEEQTYKMRNFIELIKGVHYVPISEIKAIDPDLQTFFNVNRREDLIKLVKILEASDSI